MADTPKNQINPAMKRGTETQYDTQTSSPAPIDTASATEGEGEGWPVIWLIVLAICLVVTGYLII
ncbi:hypothetical protein CA236_15440 [Sphingomonas sp. ABOLG]|jgi:hypothetical protein|uniref:hypothetical protein n=1 Tax=unclassified Sphingomonas TaxID=196159 RepID=UPI000622047E|nr:MULTISPECIES: hypothetical protein [unclassified Sphingomonas]KKI20759.1 hypothetical protein XM50_04425 [Sphingomonas sp. Ag1]RSV15082.1 hypothetical protein CA236_15440 [Sphingomonas sp. ABOLG]